MERVGRASSQDQALRRWNFFVLFLLDLVIEEVDNEIYLHSIYAKYIATEKTCGY